MQSGRGNGSGGTAAGASLFCAKGNPGSGQGRRGNADWSDGVVRRRICVFVRAKPGREASPPAAGNRNVQANAMGDADAIQPGLGETCVRTFPAPSSGMTDSCGQGLARPDNPSLHMGNRKVFTRQLHRTNRGFPVVPVLTRDLYTTEMRPVRCSNFRLAFDCAHSPESSRKPCVWPSARQSADRNGKPP